MPGNIETNRPSREKSTALGDDGSDMPLKRLGLKKLGKLAAAQTDKSAAIGSMDLHKRRDRLKTQTSPRTATNSHSFKLRTQQKERQRKDQEDEQYA